MAMKTRLFIFLCFAAFFAALSGSIKEARIDDNKMQPVTLRMGKSTILRFEDKPQKVVVGNQNYLNIEYIANDVTIQPLGRVTTNLFVYTKKRVFGFILTVSVSGDYDDLIKVFWQKSKPKNAHHPKLSLIMDKGISGHIERVELLVGRGWFADVLLFNPGSKPLEPSRVDVSLSDDKQRTVPIKAIFGEDRIEGRGMGRLRIFFHKGGTAFVVHLKLNKKKREEQ